MPERRGGYSLTHDGGKGNQLGLDGGKEVMVGQEQAVDDGLFHPLEVRLVGTPAGEDGREILLVDLLDEFRSSIHDSVDVDVFPGCYQQQQNQQQVQKPTSSREASNPPP